MAGEHIADRQTETHINTQGNLYYQIREIFGKFASVSRNDIFQRGLGYCDDFSKDVQFWSKSPPTYLPKIQCEMIFWLKYRATDWVAFVLNSLALL